MKNQTMFRPGLVYVAAVLLAACSGGGDSDHLVNQPTVLISAAGNLTTSSSGANPVTVTARSGADVQLSGENSYGGNISITNFTWKQTDAASTPSVLLLYRNASTVSFTAPLVAADTTLNFQLAVTNASGLTGTATVKVLVKAANDTDRFLSLQAVAPTAPALPHHFRVGVSTVAGLSNLAADVPLCVSLNRTVVYTPRTGAAESGAVVLPVQQVDARWLASAGGAAGFPTQASLSYTNPVVAFDLPTLNSEDVFAAFNTPGGSLTNELVPSDIDSAYLRMAITATAGSCDGTQPGSALAGSTLMMQLYDEAGKALGTPASAPGDGVAVAIDSSLTSLALTPDGSSSLTPDDFLRAQALLPGPFVPTQFETRESANAYNLALDPTSAKTTLPAWLAANCFDANRADFGAGESGYSVVHADYTNNFDLSFGRDMYFATCANGNMASVVINYPSLGAAVNKVGAFLAVAMEYTPAAGASDPCFTDPTDSSTNTGACFAKFYAFAPDERTGVFARVSSVNFDRRGQKYLPGACTVCHGGAPKFTPGQAYAAAGNIDGAFMPWDQSSLLFADTDPAFPCAISTLSPVCQSINTAAYTKAAQAPNIQKLNALAWRTYTHPEIVAPANVDRFEAPRDLLTKWYGGDPAASSAHAFDDSDTPAAWLTSGQTAAASTDLYHQVFAHYCRSCHTQINGGVLITNLQMQSLQTFAFFTKPVAPGLPPFMQQLVYGNTEMPLSRLTADRFWVDSNGGQSAAQSLALFINSLPGVTPVVLDSNQNVVGPGTQPSIVTLNGATPLSTVNPKNLVLSQGAALDGLTQSLFISSYQWSLCPNTAPAAQGTCPGALGVIGTPIPPAGSSVGAPQSGAAFPAFPTDAAGTFYLTVTAATNVIGAAPPAPVTYQLVVQ